MRPFQGLSGILIGGAAALMVAQPGWAAPTQVTGVRVTATAAGVDVALETQLGDRPQVFAVKRTSSWTADIINTQLRLPQGGVFRQDNPAPGIASVTVTPLDANSIRVTVVGTGGAPSGQVSSRTNSGLVLSVAQASGNTATPAPGVPPTAGTPSTQPPIAQTPLPGQAPPPLVPNPQIEITGGTPPVVNPAPPLLPRAVPPPVGDIAVSQADASASAIDLGTGERISRLVLREASAREVLSLLARAANLNIAYVDAPSSTSGGQQQQASPQAGAASTSLDAGPKVSLDIENESVQDVFNYVIRITGLEANRVGRTIFVGPRLPDDARNVISRSLRMNQVTATVAANFLVAQGAEFQLPINRVTFVPITGGTNPVLSRVEEPDIKVIRAERGEAPLPLSGLAVSSNDRVNIVTLTGTPRKVEFATALLSQLDARKRQVAINVRVVDINLLATQRFGSSFSFGIGNTRVVNTGGTGVINFGSSAPSSTGISDPTVVGSTPIGVGNGSIFNFTKAFLLQLQGLITSGDAKILTDPTLVVQEGQQASVKLIQEVVTNFKVETQAGTPPTVTVTIEKAEAGLQLDIALDRIDDNGFITLQVNPKISSPFDTANVNIPSGGAVATQQVTLLQRREVSSGQVRVRDNQTLILTGIIQDSERSTVNKVPILGDIPLLGALFRRSQNQHQRQEVIVVLTPQIIDDSDRANFGYNYTPGPEVQRILNQRDPGAPKR